MKIMKSYMGTGPKKRIDTAQVDAIKGLQAKTTHFCDYFSQQNPLIGMAGDKKHHHHQVWATQFMSLCFSA